MMRKNKLFKIVFIGFGILILLGIYFVFFNAQIVIMQNTTCPLLA